MLEQMLKVFVLKGDAYFGDNTLEIQNIYHSNIYTVFNMGSDVK